MFAEEERSKIVFLFESLLNSVVSFHCLCHSTLIDTFLKLVYQTGTRADENWDVGGHLPTLVYFYTPEDPVS